MRLIIYCAAKSKNNNNKYIIRDIVEEAVANGRRKIVKTNSVDITAVRRCAYYTRSVRFSSFQPSKCNGSVIKIKNVLMAYYYSFNYKINIPSSSMRRKQFNCCCGDVLKNQKIYVIIT